MSTARRDTLLAIEHAVQADWEAKRLNYFDAPAQGEENEPKYLTTFPFPYMNGRLHLGHCFSFTKAEFMSRFQRMQGRRSLWPFGFHATGTPIAACAQKIANEIAMYGNPPVFPEAVKDEPKTPKETTVEQVTVHKGKRGKSGPAKPQWVIMQSMGIPDAEIAKFTDPHHWLHYFAPLAMADLREFGCHIDYRRSFITTSLNPFFDHFVGWQFRKLRAANLLIFAKRYCVYSPWDKQPCADHDRASGEGVVPQEYTLVKLTVQDPTAQAVFKPFAELLAGRSVVLPGATLRTETVVGQTNCWVSPSITYGAFAVRNRSGNEEVFIMTPRAARNMAYQDFTINGSTGVDPVPLFEVEGSALLGLPLTAPLSLYKTIYTLPMHTITESKGTGVVMCVPSDSPDDYINLFQLQSKPEYRAKLGLKDEWVVPFSLIPIIDIPGLGTESAKVMCEQLKITGPKAKDLLEEAKRRCYQDGFYKGKMIVGPFTGVAVAEAKVRTLKLMQEQDLCVTYYEPMSQVMSRSGDECVVALCDQWYIEYGKEEWKATVKEHLKTMNMFSQSVCNGFEEALNWLAEWPCSRTFGLGTLLPCDATQTMIIDSLSDSTIYMAYYTIAHFVQMSKDGKFSFTGTSDNAFGLTPDMFTDEVFDHIFLGLGDGAAVAGRAGMPGEALERMRREFTYWYPVDLRCSGKDLIQNHLTMFLYNHAAIWPTTPGMWPRAIFCNGHIQVDGEKMSKSRGNFISLREAIDTYGADAARLAFADAGDGLDDANFVRDTAAGFIMKLTTVLDQAKELLARADLRDGAHNKFDMIFNNNLNTIITRTEEYYKGMQFRMVLNTAFHEFSNEFSQYRLNCDDQQMHAALVYRFYETLTLLLLPLAPHFAEHMWQNILGHPETILKQRFPVPNAPLDYSLVLSNRIMTDVIKEIRSQVTKSAKKRGPITQLVIYTRTQYAEWQCKALDLMHELYNKNAQSLSADLTKQIMASRPDWMTKELVPDTMAFLSFVRSNVESYGEQAMSKQPVVDDYELLSSVVHNLCKLSGVPTITVLRAQDESYPEHAAARRKCRPGEPTVAFPPSK